MTTARNSIINIEEEGVYHCISHCVRRAFLCGVDRLTGKDYSHRKEWIRSRLKELESIFAIDVLAYAIMCSHDHNILRNNPDEVLAWCAEEVARRWLKLFPKRRNAAGEAEEPHESEIEHLTSDKELLEKYRWRLCDISWFMRCLNEHIAKKANKEDGVKGRFWGGRFKAIKLEDETAIATCMVYVDLNEIRAKVAKTPEESEYTSAYERIKARGTNKRLWLSPIQQTNTSKGALSISLDEYLNLLDTTGRAFKEGKRGKIPKSIAPILQRLAISEDKWLDASTNFDNYFFRLAGKSENMVAAAAKMGQNWLKGISASRLFYLH